MNWHLRGQQREIGRLAHRACVRPLEAARRVLVTVLPAALVGVALVVPSSPAAAATGEVYPVPPPGHGWAFQGHGVGRGLGLSEYGARNRALAGHGTEQILDFYYPGTEVDHLADGATIKVALRALAFGVSWSIAGSPDLVVRDEATGVETPLADAGTRYRVRNTEGAYHVEASTDEGVSWTPVVLADDTTAAAGPLRLSGPALLHLYLVSTDGARRPAAVDYEGALVIGRVFPYLVNEVGLDAYTAGVLGRIGHADWPAASLRAMAVAVRSLAADAVAHQELPWDRCSSLDGGPYEYCEDYSGRYSYAADGQRTDWEPEPILQAVRDTAGEIRAYAGAPIFAKFGESNGGWTVADGTHPYLAAVPDSFDAAGNPGATWSIGTDTYTLASCLNFSGCLGTLRRIVVTRRDGHGQWGGRVTEMRLEGDAGGVPTQLTVSGDWWIDRCGIPGANFAITSGFALQTAPAGVRDVWGTTGWQDLFALGPFNDIQYRRYVPDELGWRDWVSLGGGAKGSPSALRMPDGSSRVFIQGTNDALYVGTVDLLGGWHGWRKLGGSVASRPYPALLPDGTIYLFYRAKDRTTGYLVLRPNGTSAGFHSLGGILATDSAPAAAATGPGRITVVAKGRNGNVYTRSLASGRWSGWVNIGGVPYGDLAAASPSAGVVDVYLRGGRSHPLYTKRAANGRWGGWVNLGGQLTTGPFAFAIDGITTVWVVGLAGTAYERDRIGSRWGLWHAVR